jgi:hypothetical protein
MPLTVYNSLTRKKEEFISITKGHVGSFVPYKSKNRLNITFATLVLNC